jgi:hypothetical protein
LAAKFRHGGCGIFNANQLGGGLQLGLRAGDIITKAECVSCANRGEQEQHAGKEYNLSALAIHKRKDVLKTSATEWKFTIARPSDDWDLVSSMRKMMMLSNIHRNVNENLWVCQSCRDPPTVSIEEPERTHREAELCRAVIRRLGVESYARPFLDGNHSDDSSGCCFRRLDASPVVYWLVRNCREASPVVYWLEFEIVVKRQDLPNARVPPLLLSFQNTEECLHALMFLTQSLQQYSAGRDLKRKRSGGNNLFGHQVPTSRVPDIQRQLIGWWLTIGTACWGHHHESRVRELR